jgi:N-acetylglucosamine kinase-like BadF-type ATPase
MTSYAGVDGGQSSTIAVIGDERGAVVGRGVGPPADLVGQARDSKRQAEAIDVAIESARRDAELAGDTVFASIACGISGYEEGDATPALATRAARVRVVHDSEIALAGALDGKPGIVVIAGTGSVALGIDEQDRRVRVGGRGFLFGDEGSAFWIARRALTLAMRREDRGEATTLGARALSFFAQPSLRAIQLAFQHEELSRPALAAFARVVSDLAASGDTDAHLLRSEAARALADLVHCADARLGKTKERRISYAGGMFADRRLRETWSEAVRERIAGAEIVEPLGDPVAGALRLAYKEAGCNPTRLS